MQKGATKYDTDVLVVGAGPVGLLMACELIRHGVSCRIIDALETATSQSRATDIQPRTLEIFDLMGIVESFLAQGRKIYSANFYADGQRLMRLGFGALETPYPFILSLPQSQTEAILTAQLHALGGQIERGTRCRELTQDEDGVTAQIETLTGQQSVRARWLVGCDGANSTVRQCLGLEFLGHSYTERFLVSDVCVHTDLSRDEMHLFMHPDGFLTMLALPQERAMRLFLDIAPGDQALPSLDHLQTIASHRIRLPIRLDALLWESSFRIHQRMVSKYQVERIFLAGDAAHIHSPAGGQGMNTGLQDAWNLAWKIALVLRGRAPMAFLESYHVERSPVARAILRETEISTHSTVMRNSLMRTLHGVAARLSVGICDALTPTKNHPTPDATDDAHRFTKSETANNKAEAANNKAEAADNKEKAADNTWWQNSLFRDDDRTPSKSEESTPFAPTPTPKERAPDASGLMRLGSSQIPFDPSRNKGRHEACFDDENAKAAVGAGLVSAPIDTVSASTDAVSAPIESASPAFASSFRLFDLLRQPVHTLLIFVGKDSSLDGYVRIEQILVHLLSEYSDWIRPYLVVYRPMAADGELLKDALLLDTKGALHARYGAQSECLYLLRPDGYIAYRCQPVEEEPLMNFLRGLFCENVV